MHTKTVIFPSEDFHDNFSPLECTPKLWISSQPEISFAPYFTHLYCLLRVEFIVSVIRLTVFSADSFISFLKGAWHLSLLRMYSLASKYTDMSLASFFERNVLDNL